VYICAFLHLGVLRRQLRSFSTCGTIYKSENIVIFLFYFLNTFLTDGHLILFPRTHRTHNLLYYNVYSTDFFFVFFVSLSLTITLCARDGGVNAYLNGRVRQAGHKFNRSSARSTYIISCSNRREHIIHTRWRRAVLLTSIENKYTYTYLHCCRLTDTRFR